MNSTTPEHSLSRWTLPLLRLSMGVFLAAWGVDKILGTDGAVGIFSSFYGVEAGPSLIQILGMAEVVLGVVLALGFLRVPVAWLQLAVNSVSTVASWKQILDPWGVLGLTEGGTHLFLATIVVITVSIILVLNARNSEMTLDARLRARNAPAE